MGSATAGRRKELMRTAKVVASVMGEGYAEMRGIWEKAKEEFEKECSEA